MPTDDIERAVLALLPTLPLADTSLSEIPVPDGADLRLLSSGGYALEAANLKGSGWMVHTFETSRHTSLSAVYLVLAVQMQPDDGETCYMIRTHDDGWQAQVEQAVAEVVSDHPMWAETHYDQTREALIAAFCKEVGEKVAAL